MGTSPALDASAADADIRTSLVKGILQSREGVIGVSLLLFLTVVVVVGPWVAPYSPTEIGSGPSLAGPSWGHLLGTDGLGRDILSRVLSGGRSVVLAPLAAVGLAFVAASFVGMIAAFQGAWVDSTAMRVIDIMLATPPLLVVLVLIAALGTSNAVLVLSVAVVFFPRIVRVLRGAAQGLRVKEYVLAAEARGEKMLWTLRREIYPNMASTLFVEFSVRLTFAIIFIATLNFLGVGVQPPSSNWGLMVSESRSDLAVAPLAALAPALAIALLSIAINLIADAATQHLGREVGRE